mgnify:CR=1 FL=1
MERSVNQKIDQRLRLTLRQLEVFAAVARGGTTRAAADEISRSQSAASNALGELESVTSKIEYSTQEGRKTEERNGIVRDGPCALREKALRRHHNRKLDRWEFFHVS